MKLSTASKIRLARIISTILLWLGLNPQRKIRRQGLIYEVDIREGIDLSLMLFGSFQRHVLQAILRRLPPDGIVFDVGANIGTVTLPVAAALAEGRVYAFEPTDFAFARLHRNVQLNPQLCPRITLQKTFVADIESADSHLTAYSSWPVTTTAHAQAHPVHRGIAMPADCGQITLDAFAKRHDLTRLSLVKIDTDGHEFAVLSGAVSCLQRYRPLVLFEACEYLMRSPRPTFADFERYFERLGYTICLDDGERRLSAEEFHSKCPAGGSLDLIAVANEQIRS